MYKNNDTTIAKLEKYIRIKVQKILLSSFPSLFLKKKKCDDFVYYSLSWIVTRRIRIFSSEVFVPKFHERPRSPIRDIVRFASRFPLAPLYMRLPPLTKSFLRYHHSPPPSQLLFPSRVPELCFCYPLARVMMINACAIHT